MKTLTELEIAAYVLGDASPELRARIEAGAADNEEFAAELTALGALELLDVGDEFQYSTIEPAKPPRKSRFGRRKVALALVMLLAVGPIVWGGYELLRPKPLLEDNFSTKTIEYSKWDRHLGRKGVSAKDGYLRLINRGSLATRQEFEGPIEIEFDWRWIDHEEWPLYAEYFIVALHTSGKHKEKHAFEIEDGLCIGFNLVEHNVHATLAVAQILKTSAHDSAPMPPEQWHHIRIVDDGKTVSVFMEGPSIDPKYQKVPILTVAIPEGLIRKRIAFFNREYVGGVNHESHVDNIRIHRLSERR